MVPKAQMVSSQENKETTEKGKEKNSKQILSQITRRCCKDGHTSKLSCTKYS